MAEHTVARHTPDISKAIRALTELRATSRSGGPTRQAAEHALAVLEHPLIALAPEMLTLIERIAREWPDVAEATTARALLARLEG